MIKKLVSVTLLIATTYLLFGCLNVEKEVESMNEEGIIFVAEPSKLNDYYESFFEDIFSFHKQLEEKKSERDRFVSLKHEETGYDDIWIRDLAPVVTSRLVKFVYAPKNLPKNISKDLNDSFIEWLTYNKFDIVYSPLVLDGGNLVWNKKDTAILTTRVLEDNFKLSREEIVKQLKVDLKVRNIILIPPETGDVLAHADGRVKFIDENTIFISDFMGDEEFRQQIEKIILTEMPNAKIIVMASAYTEQGQYDDEIASAKGLYINILETDNALYVPQFQLEEDKKTVEFIKKYVDKPVITLEVELLSTMGGAVNCLTWYCPSEFIPSKL